VSAAAGVEAGTPLAEVRLAIRWRDLDAFNHVNNASFLTYLEEARLRWLAEMDGPWSSEDAMPVAAAAEINYRAQLGWPGEVVVQLYCTRVGRSSLTIGHRIVGGDAAARLHADGQVVLVWVDRNGHPVPLPQVIRRASSG
jgi:acyl-CoA thioester hydrolase